MKNRVSFFIQNKEFNIISSNSEEEINNICRFIDKQIQNILDSNKGMSILEASILTNMNLADDLIKALKENDLLREELNNKEYGDNLYSTNLDELMLKANEESEKLDNLKTVYIDLCKKFDEYNNHIKDIEKQIDYIAIELEKKSDSISFINKKIDYLNKMTESLEN